MVFVRHREARWLAQERRAGTRLEGADFLPQMIENLARLNFDTNDCLGPRQLTENDVVTPFALLQRPRQSQSGCFSYIKVPSQIVTAPCRVEPDGP